MAIQVDFWLKIKVKVNLKPERKLAFMRIGGYFQNADQQCGSSK